MNSIDQNPNKSPFSSALWLAGFRPFFLLAFISGAVYPVLWGLIFSGHLSLPAEAVPFVQWHAHEMLFGFGWAVLGGFLLTASKNWVKIRGIHGLPLALLAAAWLLERAAVLYAGNFSYIPRLILLNTFLLSCSTYILYSLIRYHKQDTFRDNYFFMIALPLFIAAKNLLLHPEFYAAGVAVSVGLFRLAFTVMLERTTPQFMKNAMNVQLPRHSLLDASVKFLALASVFSKFMPVAVGTAVLALTGITMGFRLVTWSPLRGMRNFGIAIMYVGHLGLVLHFICEAVSFSGLHAGVGTLSTHVFTLLTMGLIIPGMLIRISQGHTGRKLAFTVSDRIGFLFMALAAFARLVLTQVWPEHYSFWISAAAVGWSLCFVIIGLRLAPFLCQPRVDGRDH